MLLFALFFLLTSMTVSMLETALFSTTPSQWRALPKTGALQRVQHLVERHPRHLLSVLICCNIIANVFTQFFLGAFARDIAGPIGAIVLPLLLTFFIAELFPKTFAMQWNIPVIQSTTSVILVLEYLFAPVASLWRIVASRIATLVLPHIPPQAPIDAATLFHVLQHATKIPLLTRAEQALLARFMTLSQQSVSKIMHMRTESGALEGGYQELPVYEGENIVHCLVPENGQMVRRMPLYCYETTSMLALLDRLKQARRFTAIVLDEYGTVKGWVHWADIVRALYDGNIAIHPTNKVTMIDTTQGVVCSEYLLEYFQQQFHCVLPNPNRVHTLGGWINDKLGKIGQVGDKVRYRSFTFTVLSASAHRIKRILIHRGTHGR